jgi:hypothetical protein
MSEFAFFLRMSMNISHFLKTQLLFYGHHSSSILSQNIFYFLPLSIPFTEFVVVVVVYLFVGIY